LSLAVGIELGLAKEECRLFAWLEEVMRLSSTYSTCWKVVSALAQLLVARQHCQFDSDVRPLLICQNLSARLQADMACLYLRSRLTLSVISAMSSDETLSYPAGAERSGEEVILSCGIDRCLALEADLSRGSAERDVEL
jgi:hypothetical protein